MRLSCCWLCDGLLCLSLPDRSYQWRSNDRPVTRFDGAIIDVDGTLLAGSRLVSGAVTGIETLLAHDVPLLFFSNNPTRSGAHYRERLQRHDLPIGDAPALTSAVTTAEYLAEEHPTATVFVIGEQGLCDQLRAHDIRISTDPTAAEVVVGSIDRAFDYDDLAAGMRALDTAHTFVVTDPDRTIPTDTHPAPGSGAIVAALEAAAGRPPDLTAGKPSSIAVEAALDRLEVAPERCLIVGDRLDTDIAMGARAGMTTVLVLTGLTDRSAVDRAEVSPDYILDSIGSIHTVLSP